MTQLQDVRKFIQKGDRAVQLLESLGYTFVDNQKDNPHWQAPERPVDDLKVALEAIIKERVKEAVKDDTRGPNWHLVEGFVGKDFKIRPENVPVTNELRQFGAMHFVGRKFNAEKIAYMRNPNYTGYAVHFQFATRPYRPAPVWLPLSACVFP